MTFNATKIRMMSAALLYLFLSPCVGLSATTTSPCQLPERLGEELSRKYPGMRVVTLRDLDEYDRKLFIEDHGHHCPGLVKVNFFGEGKPTWAVVLIAGENPNRKAELVVASLNDERWATQSLEKTDGTPVVWREGPGKYEGLYEESQTIRAKYPVIVFCGYGSWSIVYSWTGKDVAKTWLSD